MIDPNNTAPLNAGIAQANAADGGTPESETADVKQWLKRIEDARSFDENARKRYAIDRQFVRGDRGGFEVGLPIAATYVDILKAFLYAKDPDLDVQPSDTTTPPPMADILKMARDQVMADPATQQAMAAAAQGAQQQAETQATQQLVGAATTAITGGKPDPAAAAAPPIDPAQAAQAGAQAALEQLVKQRAEQIMAPYKQRQTEAKQFGQTLESVINFLWRKGRLKAGAEPMVGSAFTCGPGWLKVTWQERTATDPVMQTQLNDIQDNLKRLAAGQMELADAADPELKRAELEQQMAGIAAKVERVIARGMVVDFVAAEDVQIATGINLPSYRDASFIAHRTFMPTEDAKAAFPNLVGEGDDDKIKKCTQFFQVKPKDCQTDDIGTASDKTARDADSFTTGSNVSGKAEDASVCVWEVWNKNSNTVLTLIEGLDSYAKPAYSPNPGTTRFYPFFLYAPTKADGERHPVSMVQRTQALLEEMNRIYSAQAQHRRRCLPKTAFNAHNMDPANAKKLEEGGVGEMIALTLIDPTANVNAAIVPVAYPAIDPALYDDSKQRAMLEMAWGIQEALASTIQTAKTATEAEIQKTGTEARTGYMRDCLDDMFDDLAEYTAEIAIQKMSRDDAMQIAGPFAFWPEKITVEDLPMLVEVRIRAGSSGKPNTTAQREAWAQTMPLLQQSIVQIGQLRGSSPESIADCLEALVGETLARTGDKIDPERFLPSAPDAGMAPQQMAPSPMAPPQAQPQPTAVPAGATLQ